VSLRIDSVGFEIAIENYHPNNNGRNIRNVNKKLVSFGNTRFSASRD